ncbi:uncharacterized protein [Haliotis asinina]|uniref:uncharacterized protein n=1 Tax=Haliotis asinina TaxID=109174 RepID=UPI00353272D9
MASLKYLPWLLTCASLICFCCGQGSLVSVLNKLKQFEEDLLDNKMNVLRMEKKVLDTIDVTRTSFRAELKENIRDEVRQAMVAILQGESLQDMVKSQVVSELRHLKQGYHQMKRQFHRLSRSLRDFQDETAAFHESLLKKAEVWNRENSRDICIRDNNRLEKELRDSKVYADGLKEKLEDLNETCQIQLSRLKEAQAVPGCSPTTHRDTSTVSPPVSTTQVMTLSPEEEKGRILIAPAWSSIPHQFRQLNIHSNSLSTYQYHTMKYVTYIAYISKTRKLLIGSRTPDKIVSSTLDTSHVTVLRERVRTFGMALDEDRDIIFISTSLPRHSICRMSTRGKKFTAIIDLSQYGSFPRQTTLDTKRKRIYWCNGEKLFTVTYDGQGLTTLATGNKMYAVTLDQKAGVLYYSVAKTLMKMTVSSNVSTDMTTLNAVPRNVGLYRDTIYYSTYQPTGVGVADLKYNIMAYTLRPISMDKTEALLMCLIP